MEGATFPLPHPWKYLHHIGIIQGYPGIPKYLLHPGIILGWGEPGTPFVQVSRDSQVSPPSRDHPRMG